MTIPKHNGILNYVHFHLNKFLFNARQSRQLRLVFVYTLQQFKILGIMLYLIRAALMCNIIEKYFLTGNKYVYNLKYR